MMQQILFAVLAAVTLGGAVGVVTARTVFVSALALIASFVGVAGLYVLLQAGFLAMAQVLIYVGAISVLVLFTIMLTRQVMAGGKQSNSQWYLAVGVAVLVFGLLGVLAYTTEWPVSSGKVLPASGGTVVVATDAGEGLSPAEAAVLPQASRATDANGLATIHVPGPIAALGTAFVTSHLLAFELVSAILLVALMGAIIIARE
jgi:NADH:ubiquinone oxidoreductase subunit 6 (subunit J)